MASRRRRTRRTRRSYRRRHGGKVTKVTKLSLRKRHRGAKYKCKHPRSGRVTYHRKKSAANAACGK